MFVVRPATVFVACIDTYCATCRDLLGDVRSFDHVTRLYLGLISDVSRTSLPAISRVVGADPQVLHHFVAKADWDMARVQHKSDRMDHGTARDC